MKDSLNASLGRVEMLTESTTDNSGQGQFVLSQIKIDQLNERLQFIRSVQLVQAEQALTAFDQLLASP